jgi:hypothetical protein
MSANLSAPEVPKTREISCCSALRTLTQKLPVLSMARHDCEARLGQKSTSGGSRDSAAKAWQAKPTGPCGATVVMTVTPVQK